MPGLGTRSIEHWPVKSREAARRVIDQYGEPDEVTETQLVWHKRGPWRQIVASKILYQHNFPAPHYALFELELRDDETIEKKACRSRRKTTKPKAQGKTALAKAAVGKAARAKTSLGKATLGKGTLRKASLGKAAHAATNPSAA